MKEFNLSWVDNCPDEQEFMACIEDLFYNPLIQSMSDFKHHHSVTCLDHSLNVSYSSYMLCKALGWDYKSAARGGLLHDLFLYDWHTTTLVEGRHGFVHPKIALNNACSITLINELERDIILKHMFPLTLKPPAFKESMLVCLVDKCCALKEITRFNRLTRAHFSLRAFTQWILLAWGAVTKQ